MLFIYSTETYTDKSVVSCGHDQQLVEYRKRKNFEDFIIVWLDADNDLHAENNQNDLIQLRQLVNRLELFNDVDECVDYMTDVKHEKVFLIVSDAFSEIVILLIQNIQQIVSIYILTTGEQRHHDYITWYPKLRGVYTEITSVCAQMRRDRDRAANDLLSINLMCPKPISTRATTQNDSVHRQEESFIWAQLLKESLLMFPATEGSKQEMIRFLSRTILG